VFVRHDSCVGLFGVPDGEGGSCHRPALLLTLHSIPANTVSWQLIPIPKRPRPWGRGGGGVQPQAVPMLHIKLLH
jgi:hypothetical protein